ncbi:uncharacterized protein LOC114525566 [Dendronephthya gigantea]|uniref:uncharacterized protein LOC114525566 n=1 Tax=Dendronephthya gigantea TaxID=151771 RepID=UPI00106B165D|nr:uncharacterized protein LOC114525566 [Dendronephthya gigantea]XP_028402752.1 uncharacterized protein LOC114525566 [Dendronephthya gigantea]
MKFELKACILLIWCSVGAHCLTCNKCSTSISSRGDCGTEERCNAKQTRCLAIRRGGNQIGDTYNTRCATKDECSVSGLRQLCQGQDCAARCCTTSKCDAFADLKLNIVKVDERSFQCYECSRESLDSCTSSDQKCDNDQDACISFLMEGGNHNKVYTKRCARKNECTRSELDRLCALEKDQSNRKECRASCCFDEMCNEASSKTISSLVIAGAALLIIAVFN